MLRPIALRDRDGAVERDTLCALRNTDSHAVPLADEVIK
jgi:hypothetical protein